MVQVDTRKGASMENSTTTYTPKEVATALKISENTVRRMLRSGELPGIKIGQQWRVTYKQLVSILKSDTTAAEITNGQA